MRKISIIILTFFIATFAIHAQTFDGYDALQIEGKKYTLHKVAIGETIFSISRKYNIDMTELVAINQIGENGYTINPARLLIIPLYAKRTSNDEAIIEAANAEGYITHIVKPGETLYSIARNYIGITPQVIKQKNKLQSDQVKINQKLIIPQKMELQALYKRNMAEKATMSSKSETEAPTAKAVMPDDEQDMMNTLERMFAQQDSNSAELEVARGIATWLTNGNENKKTFYALHKYAPIGTIIKVRNLMNNKVAYVKVIGKLPENEVNRSIVIKLSRAAAKYLNVLDEKFLVELMVPLDKS